MSAQPISQPSAPMFNPPFEPYAEFRNRSRRAGFRRLLAQENLRSSNGEGGAKVGPNSASLLLSPQSAAHEEMAHRRRLNQEPAADWQGPEPPAQGGPPAAR